MSSPQVHVPYGEIGEYIGFIRESRINVEVFFRAEDLISATRGDFEDLLRKLDYGPAFTIHAPFMDLSPAAVDPGVRAVTHERFSQVFDAAEVLKPKAVVFHSGYEKWKYGHKVETWLEKSLETWPRFIKRAEALDTRIAVENIFEDTPDNLALLMKALGSERFGVCFDTGHMNIFSAVPLSRWLDSIGGHIVELHLHDNRGDLDSHLPVGDGHFDFRALFAALNGRDVIRTIEATSPAGVLTSMERLSRY